MAISLVGTIGAVTQGAAGAAVTPAYGTSENRTAGNLLVLWVGVTGVATLPATPTGWTLLKSQAGTSCSASAYYKVAAGADAAPTVATITSGTIAAQLAEFTGQAAGPSVTTPGGAATTNTTPLVFTCGTIDSGTGALIVAATAEFYSASGIKTFTHTLNNATAVATTNSGTVTAAHYSFAYGITTANSAADSDSFALTTLNLTGAAGAIGSFNPPGAAIPTKPRSTVVSQAVTRAATR